MAVLCHFEFQGLSAERTIVDGATCGPPPAKRVLRPDEIGRDADADKMMAIVSGLEGERLSVRLTLPLGSITNRCCVSAQMGRRKRLSLRRSILDVSANMDACVCAANPFCVFV